MNTQIEAIREYWNRQPCGIRHGAQPGSIEFFQQLTSRRYFVQPHIRDFADFPSWEGLRVLEIGCGLGTDAEEFAKAGAIYTGVDLSPASVALAQQRFELFELPGTFLVGNIEELPTILPPRSCESFDLIYSFGVLHHTPNPEVVLEHIGRYVHPRSELRLMVYAENSWKAAMIDAGLDQYEAQADCPLARRYTENQARALLHRFDVTSITQDHIFPYEIAAYKQHQYVLQPWFSNMPSDMFRALELKLGWHLLIKAKEGEWDD